MLQYIELILIGLGVGTYASLVGVGGGIALVPILLLLYRHTPQSATGISLAVIIFNAASASITYGRKKRIDYRTGLYFASGSIPGAILGASVVVYIPQHIFSSVFGLILISLALFILLEPEKRLEKEPPNGNNERENERLLVRHRGLGIPCGLFIGFIASLLGIGGGIIYVPVLIYLLNFTVQRAVATSLFIIAIMALGGAATHLLNGVYVGYVHVIGLLALGIIIGAQCGAKLSDILKARLIIRLFALALLAAGVKLITEIV
ncbi:MAG: sulfite exporter TauE/SafE family protein [Gemmatimonadota bacterium]|nr:MAG: sulfite exporter TauE/SafE family protein [Gemmatimonadota bacterium]